MMAITTDRRQGVNSSAAVKVPCRCATTAAITLSGLQTVDGVALAADDRVLVKDQGDATTNGIYAASSGTWTRAIDFDGQFDVRSGTLILVNQGTTNATTWFIVDNSDPVTIGSIGLSFTATQLTDQLAAQLAASDGSTLVGFLASGTGSVLRTSQNKMRDVVSVKDFGAVGDGLTDDTSSIQSAIDSVSSGGQVLVPRGIYKVTDTIRLSAPNTSLSGYGAIFKWGGSAPGSQTPVVKIGNASATTEAACTRIDVVGLTVDGNSTSNITGFYFTTCRYSTFHDLHVLNCTSSSNGYAYYLSGDDSLGLNCAENTFTHISCNGAYIGLCFTGNNGYATNCTFHGVHLFNLISVGLRFIQNCDSNYLYGVIAISNESSAFIGAIFNDGTNKTSQLNGADQICIHNFTANGGTGGVTGCIFNSVQNVRVLGLRISTISGSTTDFQNNGAASLTSFELEKTTQGFVSYLFDPPPSAAAGANAGTSPPSPVVIAGSGTTKGRITFGTGTGATAGAQVAVTFSTALSSTPKAVTFQGLNGNTTNLNLIPTSVSTSGFTVFSGGTPASSQSNSTFDFYYVVHT